MHVSCGAQTGTRYVSVSSVVAAVGEKLCKCLIGINAFTGCDKVSASPIMELGMLEWVLSDTLFQSLK